MSFRWPVRVYYEDTDAGGIVYYANYLKFFERARTEWLRKIGFNQEVLRQQGILFVVRDVSAKYRRSARLDDELEVSVQVEKLGKASFNISQSVYRIGDEKEELLVNGYVSVACIDSSGSPRAIPVDIINTINN